METVSSRAETNVTRSLAQAERARLWHSVERPFVVFFLFIFIVSLQMLGGLKTQEA